MHFDLLKVGTCFWYVLQVCLFDVCSEFKAIFFKSKIWTRNYRLPGPHISHNYCVNQHNVKTRHHWNIWKALVLTIPYDYYINKSCHKKTKVRRGRAYICSVIYKFQTKFSVRMSITMVFLNSCCPKEVIY